jgi:hypothetical protein
MNNDTPRPLLVKLGVWGIKTRATVLAFVYGSRYRLAYFKLRAHFLECGGESFDSQLLKRVANRKAETSTDPLANSISEQVGSVVIKRLTGDA